MNTTSDKVKYYSIFGGPGAGKGTCCAKLIEDYGSQYNLVHLSAGDLLRAERDSGSEDGNMINSIISEGKLVSSDIVVNLIKKAMEKNGWTQSRFLIDGFPRNQENVDVWNKILGDCTEMDFLLFLDASEEKMIQRIQKRAAEDGDQKRSDDNIDVLKKRFTVFKEQSMPIIEEFAKIDKVAYVEADGTPEEVYSVVKKLFEKSFGITNAQS